MRITKVCYKHVKIIIYFSFIILFIYSVRKTELHSIDTKSKEKSKAKKKKNYEQVQATKHRSRNTAI